MKNKKGFTLVELMAVIVILAIIIAISIPTYSKIKNNIDVKNFDNKKELIKVAATKFAEDTNITAIFVKELVENGYLEADDEDGNVYGLGHENINCYVILTEQKNGMFYSKFINENYIDENKECNYNIPNELTNGFKIEMYEEKENGEETKLEYDSNKKWWTKNNVILKAIIPEEPETTNKELEIEWYEGYNNEPIASSKNKIEHTVETTSVLQQNYTAKYKDKDGNILTARVRVYIDKIEPNFYKSDARNINDFWKADKIDYNIKAYDNESGLYGYKEIDENDVCPTNISDYKKSKKIELKNNGTRKICLIDNVGNKNEKTITVDHIDANQIGCTLEVKETPDLIKGEKYGNFQWYKSNVTVKLTATNVGPSGVLMGINETNQPSYYYQDLPENYEKTTTIQSTVEANSKNVIRYGHVKNQAGTYKQCGPINFGVEKNIIRPNLNSKSSTLTTATVVFKDEDAISGIKEVKCYRTGSDQKWYADGTGIPGTPINNSCYFDNLASANNATYKIKRCITSYAGNSICSDDVSITITGSCNETVSTDTGNYWCGTFGGCSDMCGGYKYATKTYETRLTSKYNPGYYCRNSSRNVANGCSDPCGGVDPNNPYIGSFSACSNICGGTQSAPLSYYSKDRSKICPTPSGWATTTSKSCGGTTTISYGQTPINHGIYFANSRIVYYYISYCTVNKYVASSNNNISCPQNGVSTYTTYCSNSSNSGDCLTIQNESSCNYETLMYQNDVGSWKNHSRYMKFDGSDTDTEWVNGEYYTGIGWHVGYYGISKACESGWVDSNYQVCKGSGTYVVDLDACSGGYKRNCNIHDWNQILR